MDRQEIRKLIAHLHFQKLILLNKDDCVKHIGLQNISGNIKTRLMTMFHVSFVKSNYKRLTRGKTNNMHFEVTGIVTRKKPEQVSEIHEKGYVPCSHFSNFHTHIHTHTHTRTHTHTHTHIQTVSYHPNSK